MSVSRVVVTCARSSFFKCSRRRAWRKRPFNLTLLNQLLWLGLDPRPPPPFTRTLPGTCPCPVSRSLTTTTGIHKSPLAAPHTGTHDTQIETTSHAWLISRHAARAPHPHARTMHRHARATHIHTRSLLHPHIIGADTRTVRDPVAFGSPRFSSLRSLLSTSDISHDNPPGHRPVGHLSGRPLGHDLWSWHRQVCLAWRRTLWTCRAAADVPPLATELHAP